MNDKKRETEGDVKSLSSILFNNKRLKIFEVLLGNPKVSFTLKELEQSSGVSKPVVLQFIDNLHQLGLVSKRKKGNLYLISLNQDNPYVKPIRDIMQLDSQPLVEAAEELAETIGQEVESKTELMIVLYGSVARGEPKLTSDIDLLIAGKRVEDKKHKIRGIIEQKKEAGLSFSPLFLGEKELEERVEGKDDFIKKVIKDGKVLCGEEQWYKIIGDER